jgi:type VI secretion system secreted protein VgrG
MGMSAYLTFKRKKINMPTQRIIECVKEQKGFTPNMAMAIAFGNDQTGFVFFENSSLIAGYVTIAKRKDTADILAHGYKLGHELYAGLNQELAASLEKARKAGEAAGGLFDNDLWKRISDLQPLATQTTQATSSAKTMTFSNQGRDKLKKLEGGYHQFPYSDKTSKTITSWESGSTIGYGRKIQKSEWSQFNKGISMAVAEKILNQRIAPVVRTIQNSVIVPLSQAQFDALVILGYNIGEGTGGLAGSSVLKIINNPKVKTVYPNLEQAWKAWDKSQDAKTKNLIVNNGLINRRQAEWDLYTTGNY